MNRLLASTAVALLLGLAPALAAEDSGKLPTGPGVSSEAAKEAIVPPSGSADTSGGAAEQSSAGPNSAAGNTNSADKGSMPDNAMDPSTGAKEQSSAPPGSSAASTSKANPNSGAQPQSQTE
jgi:hypothetical protein